MSDPVVYRMDASGKLVQLTGQDLADYEAALDAPPAAPTSNIIGFIAFCALFTPAEQAALFNPEGQSPALAVETVTEINMLVTEATSAGPSLDLMDPRIVAGVNALVTLLPTSVAFTAARASAVLANQAP